jgi:hypothetical protein
MPTEIVSAESKTDTTQLVTAFGQTCAYKLFSQKATDTDTGRNPTVRRVAGRLNAGCQTGVREPGKGWRACLEATTLWWTGMPSGRGRAGQAGIIEPLHSGFG